MNKARGLRQINGIWYANIQVNGKRREFRVGPDKQKAISVRNRLKLMTFGGALHEHLQDVEAKSITFSEAVQELFDSHLKNKKSGYDMLHYLDNLVKLKGNKGIDTFTWQEIEEYRNNRLGEVSASYLAKELIMAGAVFERQIKMGRIKINPFKLVEKPPVNDVRERIPTDEEFKKLLNNTWVVNNRGAKHRKKMDHHVRLALVIGDYTAMRISEVLAMKWRDLDLQQCAILIPQSKNGSKRRVPIHEELKKILEAEKRTCEHVVSFRGEPIKSISKAFMKARKEAKLSDIRIHDFRHRSISRWVSEGKPLNIIMGASGHRTYSAFLRYANLRQGDIQVLVGGKAQPIPIISFDDFYGTV
jgi:integrase